MGVVAVEAEHGQLQTLMREARVGKKALLTAEGEMSSRSRSKLGDLPWRGLIDYRGTLREARESTACVTSTSACVGGDILPGKL